MTQTAPPAQTRRAADTIPPRQLTNQPDPGPVVVSIGGDHNVFSAAHAGLHDGRFEALHGHTFTVTVHLHGELDPATAMSVDFSLVKAALREAIEPMRRKTLMPQYAPGLHIEHDADTVTVSGGGKRYVLPADDVSLLPITNTTTEALAALLLERLLERLLPAVSTVSALRRIDLVLAEAPDTRATVTRELRAGV